MNEKYTTNDNGYWDFDTNSYLLFPISLQPNMKSVCSNNLSLKYQSCTPSSCTDIGIRKFKIATKTHFFGWEWRL